jgi:hypothetical protein
MEKSNEVPENILKKANSLREKLLPVKSKVAYEKVYASFCYWRENNKVSAVTEEVILAYLDEKVSLELSIFSYIVNLICSKKRCHLHHFGRIIRR